MNRNRMARRRAGRRAAWYIFGKDREERYGLAAWWAVLAPASAVCVAGMIATAGRNALFSLLAYNLLGGLAVGTFGRKGRLESRRLWRIATGVTGAAWLCFAVFIVRHAVHASFWARLDPAGKAVMVISFLGMCVLAVDVMAKRPENGADGA